MLKMKYHFKIHKEGSGFWAECLEIPGCLTQGDSKEELQVNMEDAINTYLSEPAGSNVLAPLPDNTIKTRSNVVLVSVDPQVAMGFNVRYNRIKNGMTQKQAAKMLGMGDLYSYQRLEKRCNPTISIIGKLYKIFPELSIDTILR